MHIKTRKSVSDSSSAYFKFFKKKTSDCKTKDAKPEHRLQGGETTSYIEFSKTCVCVDLHHIHHGVLSEKTVVHLQTRDRYVFSCWISHSHLFNKLDIHTRFMYTYMYPLFLITHLLVHKLTQAIMHTYVTLEPQGKIWTWI